MLAASASCRLARGRQIVTSTCKYLQVSEVPPRNIRQRETRRSFSAVRPDLVPQWHPTRNVELTPDDVTTGSGKKVWWKCPAGPDHEWQAAVSSRVRGNGCPFCRGLYPSVTNSLLSVPYLAAEFHPTMNGDITPDQVVAGTNKKYWWKCAQGPDHEWQAHGKDRLQGKGCPFCAGHRASVTNSLAMFPKLVKEFHPTKNGDITPDQVVAGTNKKYWWKCAQGPDHEWQAPSSRRIAGGGCPFCRGLATSVTNSLANHPRIASEFHPTKNGHLSPEVLVAGTEQKVWWKCAKGPDHEWQAVVANRVRQNKGCPFCAGHRASVTNSLAMFPKLVKEFHPTKNGDITPDQVVAGTNKKYWWKCAQGPDHEWQAMAVSRSLGAGCLFCVGQRPSVTNDLNNFPELVAEFHPTKNGHLTPANFVAGTNKQIWWQCACGQAWRAPGARRLSGSGCPNCAETGYSPLKAGTFYVLCGGAWGKFGVSNKPAQRLGQHAVHGTFGTEVVSITFEDGRRPLALERDLLAYLRELGAPTAPSDIPGHTETFPAPLLGTVLDRLQFLLPAHAASIRSS
jgi:hypothetical protein